MKAYFLATLLTVSTAATAQVGIGNSAPDNKSALDITGSGKGLLIPRMDSAARVGIAAPLPDGLMVFQTDGRKGFWYALSNAWLYIPDKAQANDNLGNHSAIQTLHLNAQQLMAHTSASRGDSLAQVNVTSNINSASNALFTKSEIGTAFPYTRTLLSGYGVGPSGLNMDYGTWSHSYRAGGWAVVASGGPNSRQAQHWIGLAQGPTLGGGGWTPGATIRIVDGDQGAGKVLTSDAIGNGSWQNPSLGPFTAPLTYTTNDADKILFTQGMGANGSKLAHSVGWMLDYYAGPNNAVAGTHRFHTGTAGGWAERMRIDANGSVGIGNNAPGYTLDVASADNTTANFKSTSTDPNGVVRIDVPAVNGSCANCSEFIAFTKAGTMIGSISANLIANTVAYNTTSDKRMKENIAPTRLGLTDLMKIEVKDYNFIGARQRVTGFLAQDLFSIYPDAVKEGDRGERIETPWAIDYGKLTPLLVKAVQEQQAEIESLRQQLSEATHMKAENAALMLKHNELEARMKNLEAQLLKQPVADVGSARR